VGIWSISKEGLDAFQATAWRRYPKSEWLMCGCSISTQATQSCFWADILQALLPEISGPMTLIRKKNYFHLGFLIISKHHPAKVKLS